VTAVSLLVSTTPTGVRTLEIDRPQAKNAFDRALYLAARDALDAAADDDEVKVVVLTGRGTAFCAGADLAELRSPAASGPDAGKPLHAFLDALDGFPKPLLAAVNGVAVGLGMTMLPYFDLVVVADTARLRAPFVPLGLTPEAGSTWSLPRLVGAQEAAHLLLTGAWLDAAGAVRIGLAWRAFPAERLRTEVDELAAAIAAAPLPALRETKRLLRAARGDDALAARHRESTAFRALLATRP
jgi:enoyl-CoA hydratase/carnithine racemase